MLISVLGFVSLFSGSVFLFWVSVLSLICVPVLGLFFSIFVVVVVNLWSVLFLSATLYI